MKLDAERNLWMPGLKNHSSLLYLQSLAESTTRDGKGMKCNSFSQDSCFNTS